MAIYHGSTQANIKLGSNQAKIYLGSTLIYS